MEQLMYNKYYSPMKWASPGGSKRGLGFQGRRQWPDD